MEELYKTKDPNELHYYNGVVSRPQPDFLESKVKWALGTSVNKSSGCDGIPKELSKTLKDDAIKVLPSICQQIWKTQQWPQDWKRPILNPVPKKGGTKKCANHHTVALISHASKIMLKIFHAKLQHYANKNFQMSKLGSDKAEEPKIKLPTFSGSQRKQENSRKSSPSVSSTMVNIFLEFLCFLYDPVNVGNLFSRPSRSSSFSKPSLGI